MRAWPAIVVASTALAGPACAQSLSPDLVEAILRGPETIRFPGDSISLPIEGPRDLPLVSAFVNGRGPYQLLVDLGSDVVIFRRNVIDETGVEVVVERSRTDIVRLDSLRIGEALFLEVYGGSYDSLDVDGVVGYNALGRGPFALDFPGRRLVLRRDSLPVPDDREILDLVVDDRHPYLRARLGPDSLMLLFDTGAANHVVFPAAWKERLRLSGPTSPGPVVSNNQTGTTSTEWAPLSDDIVFGRYTIEHPTVMLDPDVEVAWLGADLLADYVLEFDPERLRVRIRGPAIATAPPDR